MGIRKLLNQALTRQDKISTEDTVIVVIGATGTGKSTFINTATNGHDMAIGDGLSSCTTDVQSVRCTHPWDENCHVVLVDTPAFNHDGTPAYSHLTHPSLRYARKIKIAGIICLHRISDTRMIEPPLTHLLSFERLCQEDASRKIILATTMWGLVDEEEGSRREQELRSNYWKTMIARGSDIVRYEDTAESAWNIVQLLLEGRKND